MAMPKNDVFGVFLFETKCANICEPTKATVFDDFVSSVKSEIEMTKFWLKV